MALRNFPPLIHIHSQPFVNFQNPISYFFELELLVKCWFWIGIKIHSIILSLTYHQLNKLSPTHTHPLKTVCEFSKPYELLFFEFRVTRKKLIVTCIKIHSIILSFTCHGLRNFPPLIHIHSKPFVNFQNPMSYYFLS